MGSCSSTTTLATTALPGATAPSRQFSRGYGSSPGATTRTGREEQYERLYLLLVDATPFAASWECYELNDETQQIELATAIGSLIEMLGERNFHSYETYERLTASTCASSGDERPQGLGSGTLDTFWSIHSSTLLVAAHPLALCGSARVAAATVVDVGRGGPVRQLGVGLRLLGRPLSPPSALGAVRPLDALRTATAGSVGVLAAVEHPERVELSGWPRAGGRPVVGTRVDAINVRSRVGNGARPPSTPH